jgi:hypothetical protein
MLYNIYLDCLGLGYKYLDVAECVIEIG